jgi:MFS family permease
VAQATAVVQDWPVGNPLPAGHDSRETERPTIVVDLAGAQRRTLRVLFATQMIGGVGVGIGVSVGALLAADLAGIRFSGFSQSASVVGSALLALPAAVIVHRRGRRPSLAAGYLAAALGAAITVIAATRGAPALLLVGYFLFGGATAANLQARFAAVDLAPAALGGRHLSMIVWATTIGAVAGPNLAAFAGALLDDYGVATLAGPFVFSTVLFALAAVVLLLMMRPDPAILARQAAARLNDGARPPRHPHMGVALRSVAAHGAARLGVMAMAVGHLVMVGVMSMTPVHLRGAGHDAAHTLRVVGVVLSVHIVGMFAFSPVIGWLTDRIGRRPVILAGTALLCGACMLAWSAEHDSARLGIALTILGLGWSFTMVAGSTLLSESVPLELRTSAQGLSDAIMGLAGASAGALSGVVMHAWGFPTLALIAALATTPFIALALARVRS